MTRNRGFGRRKDRLGLDDQGYVLLWAIFAFVVMAALAGSALRTAGSERRSAGAALRSIKAFYAAGAGLRRTLPQATDSLIGSLNPGDSLDLGWVPLPGGSSYRAVLYRVDDGTDPLYVLHSTGRSAGLFGGMSTQSQIFSSLPLGPAGLVSNKELIIDGSPIVGGSCGIHANGWLNVDGTLYHSGPVMSSGMINVSGKLVPVSYDANGNMVKVEPTFGTGGTTLCAVDSDCYATGGGTSGQPDTHAVEPYAEPLDIPQFGTEEYCGEADYHARNGHIVSAGGSDSTLLTTSVDEGWYHDPVTDVYTFAGPDLQPGTYCSTGNFKVTGSQGTNANPAVVSLLAEGSVDLNGVQFMVADHSEGILVLAEGDVAIRGELKPPAGTVNYDGKVYAGSHCKVTGSPTLGGSLTCRGDPDPAVAKNLTDQIVVNGNIMFTADCTGTPVVSVPVPIGKRSWDMVY